MNKPSGKKASCRILENKEKSSFRASEARPGIQDFGAILDSGFRRNDGVIDFCENLKRLEEYYPKCSSFLDSGTWDRIISLCPRDMDPETFPEMLMRHKANLSFPVYLPDLAQLEWVLHQVTSFESEHPSGADGIKVNPALQLVRVSWRGLPKFFKTKGDKLPVSPGPGEEFVLIWKNAKNAYPEVETASDEDLLALKMTVEGIKPEEAAALGKIPVGAVDAALDRAVEKGIILGPRSRIRRDPVTHPAGGVANELFFSASVFTLQWHITQSCDLHCQHCYDRSERSTLKLERGIAILDDLRSFCRSRNVKGQVSFTGGNPLLYPYFRELYLAAKERGFTAAILGNPAPREKIEEFLSIQPPSFFQVSLEGLPEHNDAIRGPGNFDRVMQFLKVLRELRIYSMVMLTLTQDNMDQILPLAEILRERTDSFTFNRLSRVGEGAKLKLPSPDAYAAFLSSYLKAAEGNPILALKDNLLNILNYHGGTDLFGGCTGYGCGAAFNFLTLLPDGEVHACRKFPSYLGNVFEESLSDIYDSKAAQGYRVGSGACRNCPIRPVCGGCLAVTYGHGLDILTERDPFCFMASSEKI